MRSIALDLRLKFAALAFALAAVVACAWTVHLTTTHSAAAEQGLEARAVGYARLIAHEAAVAMARGGDEEAERGLVEAARLDPDVTAVRLVHGDGHLVGGFGHAAIVVRAVGEATIERTPDVVGVLAPVAGPDGRPGTLLVELRTLAVQREAARSRRSAAGAGLLALSLGLLVSWFAGESFGRRLSRIQHATRAVARGRLDEPPIADDSPDEIGCLARDFNTMATRIRDLVEVIANDGREEMERLDAIVVARTAELQKKNEDLAFLLDHVDQGFMTVTREGRILAERSAILETWFGAADADAKVWSYLVPHDPEAADWFSLAWESLFEDVLPLEVSLDQLPREVRLGDSTFGLRYQPVTQPVIRPEPGGESFEKVIVVISDISTEIARRRAEASQKELAEAFRYFVADPILIEEFVSEGSVLVDSLRAPTAGDEPLAQQQRWLHTLKGNATFIGLSRLAALCHDLESQLDDTGEPLPAKAGLVLGSLWGEFVVTFAPLVRRRQEYVDIERTALASHVEGLRSGRARAELEREVKSWLFEPTRHRLERAGEQARRTAKLLGKPEVDVVIEDHHLRFDAQAWAPFWAAFGHVIRNAVDHGIETASARLLLGKPTRGRLTLRTIATTSFDVVEVEDDGAGIDWAALRKRAAERGFPAELPATELLFIDGLSTRDEVTETSGRGVGLAACRAACAGMGGQIEVLSTRHVGTKLSFRIPRGGPAGGPPSRRRDAQGMTSSAPSGANWIVPVA